jgi:hypothetical protein
MRFRTTAIVLVLALTILTALPGSYIKRVHAVDQLVVPTTWSPFGPATDTLIMQFYSDFSTTFSHFQTGEIDITDWPAFNTNILCNLPATDPTCYHTNSDMFLGAQQSEYGIFQLDINKHSGLFGVPELTSRVIPTASLGTPTTATGCSTGFGSLTVTLFNTETGKVVTQDSSSLSSLNNITISGAQTFTTMDQGARATGVANGVYVFPCTTQGSYVVSNSVFANCVPATPAPCTINLAGGTTSSVQFNSAWNSPSNQKLTDAGTFVRQAILHLLNKHQFTASNPAGNVMACDDIFAPPSQKVGPGSCNPADGAVLPLDILTADCAAHPWISAAACSTAYATTHESYLLNDTSLGPALYWWAKQGSALPSPESAGYPSSTDLRAACDYLVLALQTPTFNPITPTGATCVDVVAAAQGSQAQFPTGKTGYAHLITTAQSIFYVRTHNPRRDFGQTIVDGLNFLFGTANNGANLGALPTNVPCAINYGFKSAAPGCSPQYYTIGDIASIIFGDGTQPDRWALYTGGYNLTPTPDHIYALGHSQFASSFCGGPSAGFPNNYRFNCDPRYDTYAAAGEFASGSKAGYIALWQAAVSGLLKGEGDPVFSRYEQFVSLKAWDWQSVDARHSSLVNGRGTGFEAGSIGGLISLLNMRCNPTQNALAGAAFKCGGGAANTIRRAESQDTDNLNPFQATTVWDFDPILAIWDSMLQLNPAVGPVDPVTGSVTAQFIDWMTTSHTQSFNPTEVCTALATGVSTIGCTTQIWHLRPDLKFHDGTTVTASDVVFSLKAADLVPSAIFAPNVANMQNAIAIDPSTVQVKLILQSPFNEANIGSVPILPQSIWGPLCTGTNGLLGGTGNRCGDITFDPMAAGKMVGSGPFVCRNITTNVVGGTCSQNADLSPGSQVVSFGGRIVLHRNTNYMRCCTDIPNTSLHKLSWADKFHNGVVNILDIADIAFHFGAPDPYWNTGQNPQAPSVGSDPAVVDIAEVATVAFYFGSGIQTPFTQSQLYALDPQINPYFCPISGC